MYGFKKTLFVIAICAMGSIASTPSFATADGPDHYQVRNVAYWDVLNIRRWPAYRSRIVGVIPPDGQYVRNLFREVRGWCLIEYRYRQGWAKCRYLEEQGKW